MRTPTTALMIATLMIAAALIAVTPGLCQEPSGEEPVAIESQVLSESLVASETPQLLPRRFSLHLEEHFGPTMLEGNPFSELSIEHEREWREALWNAPMGRLYYELAAQQAMLGRGGLVNGGHMLGVGLGTTAIGDGSHNGMQLLMDGYQWSELSRGERFKISVQGAFAAGILYALLQNID